MRSLLLILIIIIVTPSAIVLPHLGVFVWTWISIMNPHRLSWGFTVNLPFVMIIASVTIVAWMFSREPKLPPSRLMMWMALIFVLQTTLSSFTALIPDLSWPLWDRTLKTFILFFAVACLINTTVRIQALLWILAISIGYFSTTGLMATLSSGGQNVLSGPPQTMITDNNHLALAIVIMLPIFNYLRVSTANPYVRLALVAVMIFSVITVVTSYSRGSLIALAVCAIAFPRTIRGKATIVVVILAASLIVTSVLPERWVERVSTLESVETIQQDRSFAGRLDAWYVSWKLARSRPLTGGGFSSIEAHTTFLRYLPDSTRGRAAHSLYFQVLGDHGFIGLAAYLMMYVAAWSHLRRTRNRSRGRPGLAWAGYLARMLQVSILAFLVGGAALSIAYYDLVLLLLVVAMNIDIITARSISDAATVPATTTERPGMLTS